MKKIFTILVFTFFNLSFSQVRNLTFEYVNLTHKSIIQKIEQQTPYTFYFQDDWLNDLTFYSGEFKDKSIEEVLNKLFDNTEINYFVDLNKIILTQKNLVYDKLPDGFFKKDSLSVSNKSHLPVFFQEFNSDKTEDSISLISKESLNNGNEKALFTFSGFVRNKKNNEPISDANIRIKNTNFLFITDVNGYYQLKLPAGIYTITTDIQNFKPLIKKIVVYNNGNLDLALTEKTIQLNEVHISGKSKQKMRSAVTGVTTIEAEGVKNVPLVFGERDILKIATTTPGIKTAGEGSSGYNVRGGKEDQNLFLLDKGTIYNPSHFFGFFTALNPYTIKKVDIYKGSIPSEFGGRLSSVFDITSKNGNTDKFSGEAGIGPVTSNIALSIPVIKNKASVLVGGRGTYSGWILKSLKEKKLNNSKASFYDFITKYNHKINNNNTIESTLYFSDDKFSITADSIYQYNNRLATLTWKNVYNAKNNSELTFTNSKYNFKIDYSGLPKNSFKFGYGNAETQFIAKMNTVLNTKNKLSYGISGKLYNIDPGYIKPSSDSSNIKNKQIDLEKGLEIGVYISENYKLTEKFLIDFGIRYSVFSAIGPTTQKTYQDDLPKSEGTQIGEDTYSNNKVFKTFYGFEPRAAFRYLINNDLSLKAGYDKSYQYIHLLSTNTTQSPTDSWKLSDLNVKPQSGEQFSFGIFKNLGYQDLEISAEGYYKKSKNILDYKVGADLILNENLETELLQGKGKSYGAELLIKKSEGRLNGWLSYSYSRSFIKLDSKFDEEKVNNGNYFPTNFDKPHDFSAVLNYRLTKRYSFSGNFIYQTGRPITYPVGKYMYNGIEYSIFSDRNQFRIPDYYRLDLGINIEGNHKIKKLAHSYFNISIYNVLGRNNPYSVFFVTKNGEVKGYKTSIFSIPIPTITYNFKF
ncbi:carboxypeptidase-like regulatory domain-containing protein [Flavobacterium sp.]|uniref:TonB-dependent receptor n=1 Tax=Flavobacterium sp. TaxID=239 RepID=UPI0037527EBB